MSLANIQGKLSRIEMKNIMAGSENLKCPHNCTLVSLTRCTFPDGGAGNAFCELIIYK